MSRQIVLASYSSVNHLFHILIRLIALASTLLNAEAPGGSSVIDSVFQLITRILRILLRLYPLDPLDQRSIKATAM
jgi:hypothetical protein